MDYKKKYLKYKMKYLNKRKALKGGESWWNPVSSVVNFGINTVEHTTNFVDNLAISGAEGVTKVVDTISNNINTMFGDDYTIIKYIEENKDKLKHIYNYQVNYLGQLGDIEQYINEELLDDDDQIKESNLDKLRDKYNNYIIRFYTMKVDKKNKMTLKTNLENHFKGSTNIRTADTNLLINLKLFDNDQEDILLTKLYEKIENEGKIEFINFIKNKIKKKLNTLNKYFSPKDLNFGNQKFKDLNFGNQKFKDLNSKSIS